MFMMRPTLLNFLTFFCVKYVILIMHKINDMWATHKLHTKINRKHVSIVHVLQLLVKLTIHYAYA